MKHCIVVLGMHRSGTSAATGVLSLLGGDIGATVMETNPTNPKGFFENQRLRLINDRILEALGAAWDDPFALRGDWHLSPGLASLGREVRQGLAEEFAPRALPLVKDPRMCVLMPLWDVCFSDAGLDPGYVLVLRHPFESAASLTAAHGFSRQKGVLLWMRHMLAAEAATRGRRRVFVCFRDLLSDPRGFAEGAAAGLGVEFPRSWEEAGDAVIDFLDPGLKHHHRQADRSVPDSMAPAAAFHDILCRLAARGHRGGTAADLAAVDRIRRTFDGHLDLYYHADAVALAARGRAAQGLEEALQQGNCRIREQEQVIGDLRARTRALEDLTGRLAAQAQETVAALDRCRRALALAEQLTAEVTGSRAWRAAQVWRKLAYGLLQRR